MVTETCFWAVFRSGQCPQLVERSPSFLRHPPLPWHWGRDCAECGRGAACAAERRVPCDAARYRACHPAELWLVYMARPCAPRLERVHAWRLSSGMARARTAAIPWNGDVALLRRGVRAFDERRAFPGGAYLRN